MSSCDEMTPLQTEFLEWLMDPERKGTQNEWAAAHGVDSGNVSHWRRLKKFRAALQERFAEDNTDPVEIHQVMSVLKKSAINKGDVTAAKLWLEATGAFIPTKQIIKEKTVRDLDDSELEQTVADELARRREARASK